MPQQHISKVDLKGVLTALCRCYFTSIVIIIIIIGIMKFWFAVVVVVVVMEIALVIVFAPCNMIRDPTRPVSAIRY